MQKTYLIIAYNGTIIEDSTEHAESRVKALNRAEKRYNRKMKEEAQRRRKLARNPLWRMAAFCGIV